MFQETKDEVGGGVDWRGDGEVDVLERRGVGEEGNTLLDWPECFRLRVETAVCNQKSDLIWSQVEPVLVSRSAGLRGTGHQNQLLDVVTAVISMIQVPQNTGGLAGSSLAIILRMISESLMNTGDKREMLYSSLLIFCCILVARTAPAILNYGTENAYFPRTLQELEMSLRLRLKSKESKLN